MAWPEDEKMVTFRMVGLVGMALIAGCSGKEAASTSNPVPAPGPPVSVAPPLLPPDTVEPGGTGPQYPGTGFRVHESARSPART